MWDQRFIDDQATTSIDPSHVLLAMGLSETDAFACLRFSLGRFSTESDVTATIETVKQVVEELRTLVE